MFRDVMKYDDVKKNTAFIENLLNIKLQIKFSLEEISFKNVFFSLR